MNKLPLIYIVGVGRSGTSMLMTLLNGHSQIAFTPETHFLRYYLGTADIQRAIEARGSRYFEQALEEDRYFQRLGISTKELLESYHTGVRPFDLVSVYRELLVRYRDRYTKHWIGDKDPRYLDYLPRIAQLFPEAYVIHIYRDPREIVLSKMKADWSAHRPYWLNAMISQLQMQQGRRRARRLFPARYYELAYEELVNEPAGSMAKLLAFLGLEFEPEMLNLEKSARELVDPSEMQWKDNTFRPVLPGNTQKWREQLSDQQVADVLAYIKSLK